MQGSPVYDNFLQCGGDVFKELVCMCLWGVDRWWLTFKTENLDPWSTVMCGWCCSTYAVMGKFMSVTPNPVSSYLSQSHEVTSYSPQMNQRLESVPFPSITLLSMVPIPGLLLVHTPRGLSLMHPGNVRLVDFLYTYMYIHCAYIYMWMYMYMHNIHVPIGYYSHIYIYITVL